MNLIFSVTRQPLLDLGFLVIEVSRSHSDTPHSVGILWTSDQPVAETSNWQHTALKTHIIARRSIRTRDPSNRSAADPYLRQCVHWDRPNKLYISRKLATVTKLFYLMLLFGITMKRFGTKYPETTLKATHYILSQIIQLRTLNTKPRIRLRATIKSSIKHFDVQYRNHVVSVPRDWWRKNFNIARAYNRDSSVGIVTTPLAGLSRNRGSSSCVSGIYSSYLPGTDQLFKSANNPIQWVMEA